MLGLVGGFLVVVQPNNLGGVPGCQDSLFADSHAPDLAVRTFDRFPNPVAWLDFDWHTTAAPTTLVEYRAHFLTCKILSSTCGTHPFPRALSRSTRWATP